MASNKELPCLKFPCLSTLMLGPDVPQKLWGSDARYSMKAYEQFIRINKPNFSFLGITPTLSDEEGTILLHSSGKVGCVPLISPKTGLFSTDLIVTSRYGEDIYEILPLIKDQLQPIFDPALPLSTNTQIDAPILMECVNYIQKFNIILEKPWQKFRNVKQVQSYPNSGTDWNEYALKSFDPSQIFHFQNSNNILTADHSEWHQLTYVLSLALKELSLPQFSTFTIKLINSQVLRRLDGYCRQHKQEKSKNLTIHPNDPHDIKELKELGNRILLRKTSNRCAWCIDYEKFFESYAQYVCREAGKLLWSSNRG